MSGVTFNQKRNYCFRICHIDNLRHILAHGLCTRHHPDVDPHYRSIGNPDIIGNRDTTQVMLPGYGLIGEYIPFYFTPRSIMLFNIVTGYRAPLVPKLPREEIIVFCALISALGADGRRAFFTDGQANTISATKHYNDLAYLDEVDWASIQASNFSKSEQDNDRPRRYQAEALVHHHLPIESILSLLVYNATAKARVEKDMHELGVHIPVHVVPDAFF